MFLSVDRVEENFAVCIDDNRNTVYISLELIDGEIKAGSVISEFEGRYYPDFEEAEKRKEENFSLAESLFDN